MILNLRDQLDGLSITEAVETVLDKSGYLDALSMQQTLESQARIEILKNSCLLLRILMKPTPMVRKTRLVLTV